VTVAMLGFFVGGGCLKYIWCNY